MVAHANTRQSLRKHEKKHSRWTFQGDQMFKWKRKTYRRLAPNRVETEDKDTENSDPHMLESY